ncbi:hypothetical protein MFFC18_14960 [Mariniblastus fucicola]|uniref:Uncharacterized protein n=1 Tax=Mariniblastus fucicola TaxID=980251 RepID=A0A5B9P5H0_9BACT|nr:hypothetical protein MFFC18_14960 [Mariniblastus fucicola]
MRCMDLWEFRTAGVVGPRLTRMGRELDAMTGWKPIPPRGRPRITRIGTNEVRGDGCWAHAMAQGLDGEHVLCASAPLRGAFVTLDLCASVALKCCEIVLPANDAS